MSIVKVEYESKSHERVAILLAALIGISAFIYGSFLVVAPGGDFLFFSIPLGEEYVGIFISIIGVFIIQEAKQQKRYSTLKSLIENK